MTVQFMHLVVNETTTKINLTQVNYAKMASESDLRRAILVVENFKINNLYVFIKVIDNNFV